MATFSFELVSPTRLVHSGEVEEVIVPGLEGEFGVFANHAPFVSSLRPGILTIKSAGGEKRLYVRDGFAEVNPKGLMVLAEVAVPVEEVDAGDDGARDRAMPSGTGRGQGRSRARQGSGAGRSVEDGRHRARRRQDRPLKRENSSTTCS